MSDERSNELEVRQETQELTAKGVISLARHREVLRTYREIVVRICGGHDIACRGSATLAELLGAVDRKLAELRAVAAMAAPMMVGAAVGPTAVVDEAEGAAEGGDGG